ncbi:MAG: hypothetical protein ABUL60_31045 [Myxococcales bacterium]
MANRAEVFPANGAGSAYGPVRKRGGGGAGMVLVGWAFRAF